MAILNDVFVSKEEEGKFYKRGGRFDKAERSFTKADFLTAAAFAKKYGFSKENVEKLMKNLDFHKKSFILNGHKTSIVCGATQGNLKIHPMAAEHFKELLTKQKG